VLIVLSSLADQICNSSALEDFKTVLQPSDVYMLAALADAGRLEIVRRLLDAPLSQSEICSALKMTSGTASKQLRLLEAQRLISRDRSHGPYMVVSPNETAALVQAAADLATAISRKQALVDERHAKDLRKAQFKRGASGHDIDRLG
jgi:DNA-binding transcriptional ArsR family regulator